MERRGLVSGGDAEWWLEQGDQSSPIGAWGGERSLPSASGRLHAEGDGGAGVRGGEVPLETETPAYPPPLGGSSRSPEGAPLDLEGLYHSKIAHTRNLVEDLRQGFREAERFKEVFESLQTEAEAQRREMDRKVEMMTAGGIERVRGAFLLFHRAMAVEQDKAEERIADALHMTRRQLTALHRAVDDVRSLCGRIGSPEDYIFSHAEVLSRTRGALPFPSDPATEAATEAAAALTALRTCTAAPPALSTLLAFAEESEQRQRGDGEPPLPFLGSTEPPPSLSFAVNGEGHHEGNAASSAHERGQQKEEKADSPSTPLQGPEAAHALSGATAFRDLLSAPKPPCSGPPAERPSNSAAARPPEEGQQGPLQSSLQGPAAGVMPPADHPCSHANGVPSEVLETAEHGVSRKGGAASEGVSSVHPAVQRVQKEDGGAATAKTTSPTRKREEVAKSFASTGRGDPRGVSRVEGGVGVGGRGGRGEPGASLPDGHRHSGHPHTRCVTSGGAVIAQPGGLTAALCEAASREKGAKNQPQPGGTAGRFSSAGGASRADPLLSFRSSDKKGVPIVPLATSPLRKAAPSSARKPAFRGQSRRARSVPPPKRDPPVSEGSRERDGVSPPRAPFLSRRLQEGTPQGGGKASTSGGPRTPPPFRSLRPQSRARTPIPFSSPPSARVSSSDGPKGKARPGPSIQKDKHEGAEGVGGGGKRQTASLTSASREREKGREKEKEAPAVQQSVSLSASAAVPMSCSRPPSPRKLRLGPSQVLTACTTAPVSRGGLVGPGEEEAVGRSLLMAASTSLRQRVRRPQPPPPPPPPKRRLRDGGQAGEGDGSPSRKISKSSQAVPVAAVGKNEGGGKTQEAGVAPLASSVQQTAPSAKSFRPPPRIPHPTSASSTAGKQEADATKQSAPMSGNKEKDQSGVPGMSPEPTLPHPVEPPASAPSQPNVEGEAPPQSSVQHQFSFGQQQEPPTLVPADVRLSATAPPESSAAEAHTRDAQQKVPSASEPAGQTQLAGKSAAGEAKAVSMMTKGGVDVAAETSRDAVKAVHPPSGVKDSDERMPGRRADRQEGPGKEAPRVSQSVSARTVRPAGVRGAKRRPASSQSVAPPGSQPSRERGREVTRTAQRKRGGDLTERERALRQPPQKEQTKDSNEARPGAPVGGESAAPPVSASPADPQDHSVSVEGKEKEKPQKHSVVRPSNSKQRMAGVSRGRPRGVGGQGASAGGLRGGRAGPAVGARGPASPVRGQAAGSTGRTQGASPSKNAPHHQTDTNGPRPAGPVSLAGGSGGTAGGAGGLSVGLGGPSFGGFGAAVGSPKGGSNFPSSLLMRLRAPSASRPPPPAAANKQSPPPATSRQAPPSRRGGAKGGKRENATAVAGTGSKVRKVKGTPAVGGEDAGELSLFGASKGPPRHQRSAQTAIAGENGVTAGGRGGNRWGQGRLDGLSGPEASSLQEDLRDLSELAALEKFIWNPAQQMLYARPQEVPPHTASLTKPATAENLRGSTRSPPFPMPLQFRPDHLTTPPRPHSAPFRESLQNPLGGKVRDPLVVASAPSTPPTHTRYPRQNIQESPGPNGMPHAASLHTDSPPSPVRALRARVASRGIDTYKRRTAAARAVASRSPRPPDASGRGVGVGGAATRRRSVGAVAGGPVGRGQTSGGRVRETSSGVKDRTAALLPAGVLVGPLQTENPLKPIAPPPPRGTVRIYIQMPEKLLKKPTPLAPDHPTKGESQQHQGLPPSPPSVAREGLTPSCPPSVTATAGAVGGADFASAPSVTPQHNGTTQEDHSVAGATAQVAPDAEALRTSASMAFRKPETEEGDGVLGLPESDALAGFLRFFDVRLRPDTKTEAVVSALSAIAGLESGDGSDKEKGKLLAGRRESSATPRDEKEKEKQKGSGGGAHGREGHGRRPVSAGAQGKGPSSGLKLFLRTRPGARLAIPVLPTEPLLGAFEEWHCVSDPGWPRFFLTDGAPTAVDAAVHTSTLVNMPGVPGLGTLKAAHADLTEALEDLRHYPHPVRCWDADSNLSAQGNGQKGGQESRAVVMPSVGDPDRAKGGHVQIFQGQRGTGRGAGQERGSALRSVSGGLSALLSSWPRRGVEEGGSLRAPPRGFSSRRGQFVSDTPSSSSSFAKGGRGRAGGRRSRRVQRRGVGGNGASFGSPAGGVSPSLQLSFSPSRTFPRSPPPSFSQYQTAAAADNQPLNLRGMWANFPVPTVEANGPRTAPTGAGMGLYRENGGVDVHGQRGWGGAWPSGPNSGGGHSGAGRGRGRGGVAWDLPPPGPSSSLRGRRPPRGLS
uniref:Uncharacterized protein n=1 Tax=Chromera velia CCMP2878 TaxID=1169474 RepID=A0A0G4I3L5_9ALVE|eukprot:Cvel_10695.t1-p1 / transcript=Cvel_10695.t1 / gene=Cvel_10695 / organism=Chromera_velia_CCMP2878 / gene_product=hypothetical protein / transcript_product=hypothetical protein / location=Cvel_scaffold650:44620-56058(+) / protein_length=2289 / sequence_SO=supercontig / SO=protein_coding / is_pseudo=false